MIPLGRPAVFLLFVSLTVPAWCQPPAQWKDPSPHTTRFIGVEKGIRLEVLDWGGSGRPLVLLAGGGYTAHVYDDFAPKLTSRYHVYGITRRGFGASGFSAIGYGADRLGDDVVAVIDALKLNRPVLVGHSLAGEEMSSVANRHPDRIAGLVYLDAAYPYAFDNGTGPSFKELAQLHGPQAPPPSKDDLASFSALEKYYVRTDGFPYPEAELRQQWDAAPDGRVLKGHEFPGSAKLLDGMEKYTRIPAPALVIFANPHSLGPWVDQATDAKLRAQAAIYSAALSALVERQENAVRTGVPSAKVITIAGANHFVFLSNEADVLRELRAFVTGLHY